MGLLRRQARKRLIRPARAAARRASARWCPQCQKNAPPFHVCVIRTDFRRRKTAARRGAGQRRASRPPHPYQACPDPQCTRPACLAFREGYAAGIANCPLPHGG